MQKDKTNELNGIAISIIIVTVTVTVIVIEIVIVIIIVIDCWRMPVIIVGFS